MRYIIYNTKLVKFARQNRKDSPEPEIKMWNQILKNRSTGYKFTRQKPIQDFIADFYCSRLRLAIEIDGDTHYLTDKKQCYDAKRTKVLNNLGIKVIRYTNLDVTKNIEGVYEDLIVQIRIREKELGLTPPNLPLSGEENKHD
ncbi:endonuclease domain-containing protein [Patescibacteria group bacterium]|nr:endonuclease domain-containing protein [Patescibacteria group bacterium]